MKRIALFVVALLSIAISADAIDASCGGGSGLFARFRARRAARQSAVASYSRTTVSYGYAPAYSFDHSYGSPAFRYVAPQAPAGCNCPQNPPAPDAPMATPPKTSSLPAKYQVILSTRAPQTPHTHSHVAEDGSIHAWDHNSNPGHVCNVPVVRNGKIEACGVTQNVQDARKHAVTVAHVVRVDSSQAAAVAPQSAPTFAYTSPVIYRANATRGSCPNGSCPYVR